MAKGQISEADRGNKMVGAMRPTAFVAELKALSAAPTEHPALALGRCATKCSANDGDTNRP